MVRLQNSIQNRNSDAFQKVLKTELENLESGLLPLEKGTSQGGHVDDSDITATVLNVTEDSSDVQAKVGIFFTEIVINCGCGDDPMPINAYCEMIVRIDKATAEAEFMVS